MAQPMLRIFHGIPVPAKIVTETVAVLAVRGVGKTYFMLKETEQFLEFGVQVCWIDAMGVASGLRSSADGKRNGYPITILGGDHADIPLVPSAGAVVAELVASNPQFSCILDISDWRKHERKRFVTEFMEELFHRKKKQRSPLHLFLDEVDYWAPQKPEDNLDPRMLGALDDIVRRGRIYGIGATFATQRSQVVNKNLLSQVSVLVMMRTNSDSDLEIFLNWAKRNASKEHIAEVMQGMDKLETGYAWVLSPYLLKVFAKAKVLERVTFDSSKTPELGETVRQPKQLAPVDILKIKEAIEASGQLVQSEDPKVLKARIRELEVQLRAKPAAAPAPAPKEVTKEVIKEKPVKVEVPAISAKDMVRLDKVTEQIQGIVDTLKGHCLTLTGFATDGLNRIIAESKNVEDFFEKQGQLEIDRLKVRPTEFVTKHVDVSASRANGDVFPPRPLRAAVKAFVKEQGDLEGLKLKTGELAILATICRWHPADVSHERVGLLTGYIGSTYDTYLNRLKRFGMVESGPQSVRATEKGHSHVSSQALIPPLPEGFDEVVAMWKGRLKSGEASLLNAIAYSKTPMTLVHWSEAASIASMSTMQTYVNRLKRFELVKRRSDGLWERNEEMV